MTMLHCYWQYTEATKNQPQTSWLKPQTILPIELGQFSGTAINPSISISQPIQVTEPSADPIAHEPNATAPNSNLETQDPRAETKSNISTEINATVSKQIEPSVEEKHSIAEIQQPIETTESGVNETALTDALTDPITPTQEQYSAALDTTVETQEESIAVMEPTPISETDENALEHNATLTESLQEYIASTPEPKEEK